MSAHCILTASSLRTHDRKGREGKGREKEGKNQDQVFPLTQDESRSLCFGFGASR